MIPSKELIFFSLVGVLAVIFFSVVVFHPFPTFTVPRSGNVPQSPSENNGTLNQPQPFLLSPESLLKDNNVTITEPSQKPSISKEYTPPSLQDLRILVPEVSVPAAVPPPQTVIAVTLPQVSDSEITIDPQGITTEEAYITYFVMHFADTKFDNTKFGSVLKNEYKLPILPIALIEKGLKEKNFSGVRDSLLVYQDFIRARISFLKTIRVSGAAMELDKKMIGFDKLTISLIDKFLAAEPGTPSEEEFKSFFSGFKTSAFSENRKLLKQFGISAFLGNSNPLASLLDRFIVKAAFAATADPFGGMIGVPIYCVCDAGFLIPVGPPKPPLTGSLFASVAFISSPLFFPFESLKPGAWWLGLDLPAPTPCMQPAGPVCAPQGFGSPVFMAGTSI